MDIGRDFFHCPFFLSFFSFFFFWPERNKKSVLTFYVTLLPSFYLQRLTPSEYDNVRIP